MSIVGHVTNDEPPPPTHLLTPIENIDIMARARDIVDRYLTDGAVHYVHLDSDVIDEVRRGLVTASESLFNRAEQEVYLLLKQEIYPRFIESPFCPPAISKGLTLEDLSSHPSTLRQLTDAVFSDFARRSDPRRLIVDDRGESKRDDMPSLSSTSTVTDMPSTVTSSSDGAWNTAELRFWCSVERIRSFVPRGDQRLPYILRDVFYKYLRYCPSDTADRDRLSLPQPPLDIDSVVVPSSVYQRVYISLFKSVASLPLRLDALAPAISIARGRIQEGLVLEWYDDG